MLRRVTQPPHIAGPLQASREKRQRQNDNEIFAALRQRKKENPAHKSKSVAALPYNRPFAATHMLFLQTRPLIINC
jgi:hypothetical protein